MDTQGRSWRYRRDMMIVRLVRDFLAGEEINLPERAGAEGVARNTMWRMVVAMQDELGLIINRHNCWQMSAHAKDGQITDR